MGTASSNSCEACDLDFSPPDDNPGWEMGQKTENGYKVPIPSPPCFICVQTHLGRSVRAFNGDFMQAMGGTLSTDMVIVGVRR